MTFHLLLDTSLARQADPSQKTHDFQIFFNPPIVLDDKKNYEAALDKLVTMTYSWHNVAAEYNNNQLKWRKRGDSTWKTLTIPDGMYKYTNLASYIQEHIGYVDKDAAEKQYIFNLYFDLTVYRVVIGIAKSDWEIDLSIGEFADLLGFDKKILQNSSSFVGDRIPNITRGVDWVFIHCDIVTRRVRDVPSDVLFTVSTVGKPVSYPFSEEPYRVAFHSVNKAHIHAIGIRITDGRNNILNLNGADVAANVVLREVQNS